MPPPNIGANAKFKKAPSNRGLRRHVGAGGGDFAIQKSPIKSGIKTVGLCVVIRNFEFKKAPSNRGLRPIKRPL